VLFDMLKSQVGELRLEMELSPEDQLQLPVQPALLPSFENESALQLQKGR